MFVCHTQFVLKKDLKSVWKYVKKKKKKKKFVFSKRFTMVLITSDMWSTLFLFKLSYEKDSTDNMNLTIHGPADWEG